jgi:hypothetical protein
MSTNPVELLLVRLFASPNEVGRFLADRESYAQNCGLSDSQIVAILAIDEASLRFAVTSFERKRRGRVE